MHYHTPLPRLFPYKEVMSALAENNIVHINLRDMPKTLLLVVCINNLKNCIKEKCYYCS